METKSFHFYRYAAKALVELLGGMYEIFYRYG